MSIKRNFLQGVAVLAPLLLGSGAHAAPSFDCRMATEPDEFAICADPRLSALDVMNTDLFRSAMRYGPRSTLPRQRGFLAERGACGGDRVCIIDAYISSLGAEAPSWAFSYRQDLNRRRY